ncbi:MAG: glycosyltransferase family 4 protein, partial [Bacteroidales bacterium]|nr:glycosyltransferase family 4 protein [Bacteroidales bacterium]
MGMILDDSFPPDPRVENEALSLIEDGHQVFLYCLDYMQNKKKYENIKGIFVQRQHFPKYVYKLSALAYTIPFYHIFLKKSLKEFILRNEIDVIHVHDMQIARSVFAVGRKLKKRIVLDLHENRPEIMKFYGHVNSFLGKLLIHPSIWKRYEYKYIKEADKVVVVTEEAKEYYLKEISVNGNKFAVVPNTVRKEFYENYIIDNEIVERYKDAYPILYLGDTGLRRGVVIMIKSLEKLIKLIPNI